MNAKHLGALILTLFLTTLSVWSQKKGCVISIEGDRVYVDYTSRDVKVGDKLNVYTEGGELLEHPVTKEEIKREIETMGQLVISECMDGYSVATAVNPNIIGQLKKGTALILLAHEETKARRRATPILSNGQLSLRGMNVYQETERIYNDELPELFSQNPNLYFDYKRGRTLFLSGVITSSVIGAGSLFVLTLNTFVSNPNDGVWVAGGIGAGITALGVVVLFVGKDKMNKSIRLHNRNLKTTYVPQLDFGVGSSGLGVRFSF